MTSARRCYVCNRTLPVSDFWRNRRICIECQSAQYRKPRMPEGFQVLANPVPHVEAKCLLAACTAAAVIDGLCSWHDRKYRRTTGPGPICIECGAPLVLRSEKAVGACFACVGWWASSVTGRSA